MERLVVSGRPIYVVGSDGDGGVTRVGGGRLATRPPAGHYGRVYLVIEAEGLYWTRDNSVTWETVGASEGAASILAKLLTLDGAGSGLDADLLDGQHGTHYATAQGLSVHVSRTDNPHATTHVQTNPTGANPAAAAPQDTTRNKHVSDSDATAWETHRGRTDNPHGTTLGQIGAIAKAGDSGVTPFTLTRDPNQALEPATMQYVDAARAGLDLKQSVRVATAANVDLATGGLLTVDGVGLAAGDRVLVKDQTTASGNGIYLAASGAWGRAPDADSGPEVTPNAFVFVEEGSGNQDTGWVISTNGPITLGTTAITWTQFSGPGAVTAGAGLARTGNQLSVASAGIVAAMLAAALKDGTATDPTMRSLGTGASQAAAGNDGRLSDTRTPTDGSVTRAKMSQTNRGLIICTSTTRPTGTDAPEGQHIYETDTDATLKNTGTPDAPVWSALGGGGSNPDSSTTTKGVGLVSVAPSDPAKPIFAGTNDPRLPVSSTAFLVSKNADQSVPINTATKLTWQVVETQVGAAFDLTNSRFVADASGQLWVQAVLGASQPVDGTNVLLSVYKNGVLLRPVGGAHAASARQLFASGGTMAGLAVGDFVEIYATYAAPSGTAALNALAAPCSFTGYWIRR